MAEPNQAYNASTVGLIKSRLRLFILFAVLLQVARVAGQTECTTYPCSLSVAIYGVSPPPLAVSSTPDPPKPTPTSTSSSSSSSSSTSSSSTTSSLAPFSLPSPSSPLTTSPTSLSPTNANSNAPSGSSTPDASPSSTQTFQSQSSSISSGNSTQIRLPSFSTTSSILPSITKGPSLNSSSTNSTTATQCGQCSVRADQVQVYYWPTASVRSDCARASAAVSNPSVPVRAANATTNSTRSLTALASAGTTDVVNGFTYTFPSTYVSVVGKIQVSNSCGTFGKTYTNPPPVAVQAITTASYATWPSECRPQGNYVDAVIDTLHIADIACPTWGLSDPFMTSCDGSSYLTATEGPPYNPVILVPTEFLGYDPSWGECTQIPSNGPFLLPCGVYDPPRALQTGGALEPTVDPAPTQAPAALTAAPALVPPPAIVQPTPSPQQQQQPSQTTPIPPAPIQTPSNVDPGQSAAGSASPSSQDPGNQASGNQASGNQASGGQNDPNDPGKQASGNQASGGQSQDDPNQSIQGSGSTNNPANAPGPNEGAAASGSNGTPNNQHQNAPAPSAPNPQRPTPEPLPVPQTTINIGGGPSSGQSGGGIGSIVNGAFGATPPQGTPPSSGSQGGNGGTYSGGENGGNSGGSSGGSSGSNAGGSGSGGGSSGTPSGNTGGGPAGNPGNKQGNAPANAAAFTPHAITALGATLSALNPTAVAVGGKTLSAGGPAFTSNGNFYSVGPSGNLVAGTLTAGAATPAPAALTFAGQTYTANPAGQFIVGGQTLAAGQAITVSGTPISEAAGGSFAVIGGSSTQPLITPAPSQGPALLTLGGSTFTANAASQFVLGSQTLTPGGQITVSGTVLSEGASGSGMVVVGGSHTHSLTHGSATGGAAIVTSAAVMSFGGQTYTANGAGAFVVGGQTWTPGGVITVSGTRISEGASATDVVIGLSTEVLSSAPVMVTSAAVLTFGGQTYTADAQGDFTVNGQTLTPGGVITVSGTTISEAKGTMDVVIGTSTEALSTAAVTQSAMAFEGGAGGERSTAPGLLLLVVLFAAVGGLVGAGLLY